MSDRQPTSVEQRWPPQRTQTLSLGCEVHSNNLVLPRNRHNTSQFWSLVFPMAWSSPYSDCHQNYIHCQYQSKSSGLGFDLRWPNCPSICSGSPPSIAFPLTQGRTTNDTCFCWGSSAGVWQSRTLDWPEPQKSALFHWLILVDFDLQSSSVLGTPWICRSSRNTSKHNANLLYLAQKFLFNFLSLSKFMTVLSNIVNKLSNLIWTGHLQKGTTPHFGMKPVNILQLSLDELTLHNHLAAWR